MASRWQSFERFCVFLTPILEAISHNGLGIDAEYQKRFLATIEAERDRIYDIIQAKVPIGVLKIKTWKKRPKVIDAEGYAEVTLGKKKGETLKARVKVIAGEGGGTWCRLPFSPRSWQQVADLAAALGAKLPRKVDSTNEDDVSTEAKHLKKAAKKFPVFDDILRYRQHDKLVTSYAWKIDDSGRVHPTFGFHPSTWRKSCRNPNVQTIPKRNDLAEAFRRMIVPRPGNVLIEGDSAAIEAVIVGYLAGSRAIMRLAKAGIHDWVASAYHGEPISLGLPDTELSVACASAKKRWPEDHDKFKRVVYLSLYLGTAHRIIEEYPDDFEMEGDAKRLQNFFFSTEPGKDARAWQKKTVEIAHANKGLENSFGLRHRFYSLYQWNSYRQSWEFGDDAKRSVAFGPQSDASFVQSDILLRLVQRDIRFLGWIVAIVHDSIVCDVPECDSDVATAILHEEMTAPVAQLGGLAIGCEIKRGHNLAKQSSDNPEGMRTWQPKVINCVNNAASAQPGLL